MAALYANGNIEDMDSALSEVHDSFAQERRRLLHEMGTGQREPGPSVTSSGYVDDVWW